MSKTSKAQIYNTTIDLGIGTDDGFRLLAEQKLELQKLIDNGASDVLNGLVNLIDHIQDTCADENNVPEHIVFPNCVVDKKGTILKVGDDVLVDHPSVEDAVKYPHWSTSFYGTISEIKSNNRKIIIVVKDMDNDSFDVAPNMINRL